MKFQIEDFIAKLNTIQCSDSIEFRTRFQKKWLKYLTYKDTTTESELMCLITEYQKFVINKKCITKVIHKGLSSKIGYFAHKQISE